MKLARTLVLLSLFAIVTIAFKVVAPLLSAAATRAGSGSAYSSVPKNPPHVHITQTTIPEISQGRTGVAWLPNYQIPICNGSGEWDIAQGGYSARSCSKSWGFTVKRTGGDKVLVSVPASAPTGIYQCNFNFGKKTQSGKFKVVEDRGSLTQVPKAYPEIHALNGIVDIPIGHWVKFTPSFKSSSGFMYPGEWAVTQNGVQSISRHDSQGLSVICDGHQLAICVPSAWKSRERCGYSVELCTKPFAQAAVTQFKLVD